MLNSNIIRLLKNNKNIVIIVFLLLLPSIEIIQIQFEMKQSGIVPNPNFAFFLSGFSRGHALQILLLWILPIYYLILISENVIQDYQTGYRNILISKMGCKKYFLNKMFFSFIVSFLVMLFSLILNLIIVHIIFKGGIYSKFEGVEILNNKLFTFCMQNPLLANIFYSIVASIMAGLAGLMGCAFSIFFLDKKYAYPATFIVWIMLVIRDRSIMLIFQPFIEYNLKFLCPIFITTVLIISIISLTIYLYEVYYAEK